MGIGVVGKNRCAAPCLIGWSEAVREVHKQGIQLKENAIPQADWSLWSKDRCRHQVSQSFCLFFFSSRTLPSSRLYADAEWKLPCIYFPAFTWVVWGKNFVCCEPEHQYACMLFHAHAWKECSLFTLNVRHCAVLRNQPLAFSSSIR